MQLASELEEIVQDLSLSLNKIRRKEGGAMIKSLVPAIQATLNASKIQEGIKRLTAIRVQIDSHMILRINAKIDLLQLKSEASFLSLDKTTKEIVNLLLEQKAITATQTLDLMYHSQEFTKITVELKDCLTQIKHNFVPKNQPTTEESIFDYIKARLDFSQRMDRCDGVMAAHQQTFQWIFQDNHEEKREWDSFSEWLRSDNKLYWISGKAGSGKSTLVKFLVRHPQFKKSLEVWAKGQPLIIVEHYFWNAGSSIQKSQEGLFRTLLLSVHGQQPAFARLLFPDRYQPGIDWGDFPTTPQLLRSFRKLISQTEIPARIVLVIDGLDEFETTALTFTELADIFIEATQGHNCKLVLSSRPLSAFEYLFKEFSKLRLHLLTEKDIEVYVRSRFARHERIASLSANDSSIAAKLISDIINGSSGVFLWVRLVVDSLIEGFQNHDGLEDLQFRLKSIPRDIEKLFERMWCQIPPEYKLESSQIFQLVRCWRDIAQEEMDFLGLYYADYSLKDILAASIRPFSPGEVEEHHWKTQGRLRSRCAGLLDITPLRTAKLPRTEIKVNYLHRTVADWLAKESIWRQITAETSNQLFFPSVTMSQSCLMILKRSYAGGMTEMTELESRPHMSFCTFRARTLMWFAGESEILTGRPQTLLLNECDRVMNHVFTASVSSSNPFYDTKKDNSWYYDILEININRVSPKHNFLGVTIRFGLKLYVGEIINSNGGALPEKKGAPLLYYCFTEIRDSMSYDSNVSLETVELLLEHGADPNERYGGLSAWKRALMVLYTQTEINRYWVDVLRLFLKHGADTHVCIKVPGADETLKNLTVVELLQSCIGTEMQYSLTKETRRGFLNIIRELEEKVVEVEEPDCGLQNARLMTEPVETTETAVIHVSPTRDTRDEPQKTEQNMQGSSRRFREFLGGLFKRTS